MVDAVFAGLVGRELRVRHEMDSFLGLLLLLIRQPVADEPYLHFDQVVQLMSIQEELEL